MTGQSSYQQMMEEDWVNEDIASGRLMTAALSKGEKRMAHARGHCANLAERRHGNKRVAIDVQRDEVID